MITVKADLERLRTCVPLESLSLDNFQRLCSQARVEELPVGTRLFRNGDEDQEAIYLLFGEVELQAGDNNRSVVQGWKENARYALANLKPRRYNGVARTPIKIARMDGHLLDKLLVWDAATHNGPAKGLVVDELEVGGSDGLWMMRLLQKRMFLELPAAHIQKVLARMESIVVKSGQVIIRQGDMGDYYYVVRDGRCRVTRQIPEREQPTILAELSLGDSFGEEALVSHSPRNATVTMVTDGCLMRLSGEDFSRLLEQPVLRWFSPKEVAQAAKDGAIVVDVRTPEEHANNKIRGSVNLPLQQLRNHFQSLEINHRYVCYCDTGERSSAAAYLLRERGFDACVMRGGLALLADLLRDRQSSPSNTAG